MNMVDPSLMKRERSGVRLAIIGLSQAPELLEEICKTPMKIVGIADFHPDNRALETAKKQGIFVTNDYTELLERSDLDLILNLVPDRTVEAIIQQLKPDRAQVVHASPASCLVSFCRETHTRRALIEILEDVAAFLAGYQDRKTILGRVLRKILEISEASAGGLWAKRKDRFVLVKGLNLTTDMQTYGPPLGTESPFERIMEDRDLLWINDVASDPSIKRKEEIVRSGYRDLLMIPLIEDFEVQATLTLFYQKPPSSPFSKESLRMLQCIGELLSQVLEREGIVYRTRDLLIRDELSGLYNDSYFMDRLRGEIRRASRNESSLSLLYIMLRPNGDTDEAELRMIGPYLRAVAANLVASVRNVDISARWKDSFATILPETPASEALRIARRLLDRLSKVDLEGVGEHSVELSVGIASYPENGLWPKELIEASELAARLASREGTGGIRVFPAGQVELNGLTPEAVVRQYPSLSEIFQLLSNQGARDPSTYSHAKEVAYLAGRLAQDLELPAKENLEIGIAGWLHDIGKMTLSGLNGDIRHRLSRLPKLDSKTHPTIGAYILKNLIRSPVLLRGVLYHHAHYDGSGEPPGIKGGGIPLEARIIAVADTYQHLKWERDNKKRYTQTEVFQTLRERMGRELDPELVERLIRIVSSG